MEISNHVYLTSRFVWRFCVVTVAYLSTHVIQVKEGCFRDMLDMLLKEEVALKDESDVGRCSGAVDSEVEVFGCLEQVG